MGAPFSDITIYAPTPNQVGTSSYLDEVSLLNFVSDLYVQRWNGYKPPKITRITIQPAYHEIWNRTWKIGSIVAIAPSFNYAEYAAFDKHEKYKYILDLIHGATLSLSDEYNWDRAIFENAYAEVVNSNFAFKIDYPAKQSRDKKKIANVSIEKTETVTSVSVNVTVDGSTTTRKLFDKKNVWWYDCAYILARHNKWFDTDRFGICYGKRGIDVWYSVEQNKIALFENGNSVKAIDFRKHFLLG